MEAVDEAIAFDDRLGRAEGNYLKTELLLKYDGIKPEEAIERFESLCFAWRGGDYEFRLLNRIANLHIDQEQYGEALKSLREIITYFPDDDASKEAGSRMDELFRELFLNGRANKLDPINALALYFDFRELTPGGRDGDQMIRILADRLAAVDLLDRAAQLLDHQVKFRLRGEQKARVGARLAVIHLLDQKPSDALRILRASRWVKLPKAIDAERRHLQARALVELDRDAEALKLIGGDPTRSAELIRSEIHWRRKDWVKAAASLESILGDRWKIDMPLDEIEQTQILRLAMALTFENSRAGLDSLRRRYAEKMQAGTNASGFDLLTGNFDRTKTAFRELSQQVATLDTVDAFMAGYYDAAKRQQLSNWLNSRIVCICDRVPGTSGGWVMDGKGFQVWLSAARGLTRAQRREALAVLSGRSEGEASKAAIELGVDEARRCPHCASEGAVSRGMARGLRRYQCKGCGRTFNALTGTPLSGLHHKERWLSFGTSLAKGETVKASAARCDVAVSTAFRWRHRFLAAARSDSEVLKGIVEADETYVLESRKGARGLERKARRRG